MTPEVFENRIQEMSTFENFCALLDELTKMGITDKAHPFRKKATEKARADKLATEEDHWFIIYEEERDDERDLKKYLMQAETFEAYSAVYHDAREYQGEEFQEIQRCALIGMLACLKKPLHFITILKIHGITLETPLDSMDSTQQEILRRGCEKMSSFCKQAQAAV